ncbi:hypothetical protein [Parahaliea mediterranea]|uniref:Uncharacterized protein n=1 Tax=Parahaliea mediterranea TaxID=651086 RepID=A0A939IKL2_9GAMM|nr:hypothetical protein [Parahaliea mediterranea]MBN7795077.1 hypothetical protein [Parahaliea mediterranea]
MKLLIRASLAAGLAVVALGVHRFHFTTDDLHLKESARGSRPAPCEAGAAGVMRCLFSLDTREPFRIRLPDSDKPVTLSGVNAPQRLAVGDYQDGPVRGQVLLDYQLITPLNLPGISGSMQFVAPFAVTTQGSGAFWYLGMFNIDLQSGHTRHLASEFLGDRVHIEAIDVKTPFDPPYSVTLSIKTRTAAQSMAEAPAEPVQRTFQLDHDSLQPSSQ